MNDKECLAQIKSDFDNNLKDGLLNLQVKWLIERAEKAECMEWALNIIKGRTSCYPQFDQFHFIDKQGLGEENSPFSRTE